MDPGVPLRVQENVPLAPLTTLKVGGSARFFVEAATEEDVLAALEYASSHRQQVFILGGGSNILVSDAGFDGLVVQIALKGIRSEPPASAGGQFDTPTIVVSPPSTDLAPPSTRNYVLVRAFWPPADAGGSDCVVTASAGEDWDEFVEYCVDRGLAGLECLSGIPGFVGGTPVQNVGAYGQEVSETIVSVRCLDRETNEIVTLSNADCDFSYRRSIFNSTVRNRFVVLSATFALKPGGEPKIVYKDLEERFAGGRPTLAETREAVLKIRAAKSMVIDPDDPNSKSAGSFFKNPIVDRSVLPALAEKARVDAVPHFDAGGDLVKVPAAWLIEKAGFQKGFTLGNAGISTNHSLALINRGGARAREILELKDRISGTVAEIFEINLVPEPIFVGF